MLEDGSTPTPGLSLRGGITDMRPGTYIYGDANQVALGSQRLEDCALGVVATVVSTPASDRAVVDAGSKALSADLRVAGLSGYGMQSALMSISSVARSRSLPVDTRGWR